MSRSSSWSARALRHALVWGALLVALMVTAARAWAASPVSRVTITQNASSGNPAPGSRRVAQHFWIERLFFVRHRGGHDNRVTISYQSIAA